MTSLMFILTSVVATAIITSLRTAPDVTSRADSAIAVQGITTFLPPDVDSTEPGGFDVAPGTPSGCAGVDEGINTVHMTWHEEFFGTTTTFVANYRFVSDSTGGVIQRVTCSGQWALGAPRVQNMSAALSATPPTVSLYDSSGDGENDQIKFTIETLSGEVVYIDAASKNPAETLPPNVTNPTTTTTSTSTTTSTTSTTAPNQPPVANATAWTVNPSVVSAVSFDATDPDGTIVSSAIQGLPAGWTAVTSGTSVDLTAVAAPGLYIMLYSVTDDDGATTSRPLTVTVSATATTTTTTTTSTTTTTTSTTTTTTTTLPPCTVSGITVSPNPVKLKFNSEPSKLKNDVDVEVTVSGGYCVGLTLQYNSNGPGSQHVQNLGNAAPYDATLFGHPHGSELWTTGDHVLEVRDSFDNLLDTITLTVDPK